MTAIAGDSGLGRSECTCLTLVSSDRCRPLSPSPTEARLPCASIALHQVSSILLCVLCWKVRAQSAMRSCAALYILNLSCCLIARSFGHRPCLMRVPPLRHALAFEFKTRPRAYIASSPLLLGREHKSTPQPGVLSSSLLDTRLREKRERALRDCPCECARCVANPLRWSAAN